MQKSQTQVKGLQIETYVSIIVVFMACSGKFSSLILTVFATNFVVMRLFVASPLQVNLLYTWLCLTDNGK